MIAPWNPEPNLSLFDLVATTDEVLIGGWFTSAGGHRREGSRVLRPLCGLSPCPTR